MTPVYADLKGVSQLTTLCVSTIQKLVRADQFPKPRLLSGRRVAWLVREVVEWAEARPASELLPPPNTGASKPKRKAHQDSQIAF